MCNYNQRFLILSQLFSNKDVLFFKQYFETITFSEYKNWVRKNFDLISKVLQLSSLFDIKKILSKYEKIDRMLILNAVLQELSSCSSLKNHIQNHDDFNFQKIVNSNDLKNFILSVNQLLKNSKADCDSTLRLWVFPEVCSPPNLKKDVNKYL